MQEVSSARFTRPSHVDLELVAVAYHKRSFPVHIHDQYVVGVVESGAERLQVGGKAHVVGTGEMITLDPGLAHSNCTLGTEVLRYRVFYLPCQTIASYTGRCDLRFDAPKRSDAPAAERLADLHRWFELATGDRLEQESAVAEIVDIAFGVAGRQGIDTPFPEAVRRAQRFIDAHYRESFGLDDLAEAAGASKFHLGRSFSRALGLSPLAYRTQRRIHEARRLILRGASLAQVATDLGFSDQSHLTRQFQSIVGTSPGRYKEQ